MIIVRRHSRLINPVFAILLIAFLLMTSFNLGHKFVSAYWPDLVDERVTQIGSIPLYTDFLPDDYAGRTNIKRRIKWIVIHETGNTSNGSDAAMHNKYLHSEEQKDAFLSWHYTVDDEKIYHHLPDNEAAYHASDSLSKGGGNTNGIGVEICVNADGNYNQAVDNAAKLVAFLLNRYDLDIEDVKQHGDFTKKDCPENLRQGDNYEQFLKKIEEYM